jgi:protein transport protein HofC
MSKISHEPFDDDSPAEPGRAAGHVRALRARRRQFGLRHIMGASVVVGLVFAAIAHAVKTNEPADAMLAVFAVAAAVTALGLSMALRLERWSAVGWMLAVLAPTAAALATVWSDDDKTAPIGLACFLLPMLIGTMIQLVRRVRAAHQETLLWVLALAAERGRPLGPAVAALAAQSSGRNRARLRQLTECLERGLTLPEAFDFVPRLAPSSARLVVRVGHDCGALAKALHEAATGRSARPPGWQSFSARIAYLCFVMIAVQVAIGVVMFWILPRFEAIFNDFQVPLPAITITLIRGTNLVAGGILLPIFAALELFVLLALPFLFAADDPPLGDRAPNPGIRWLTGLVFAPYGVVLVLRWIGSLFDRFFFRRHSVLVLRCMAMVIDAGRPIGAGLRTMAVAYPMVWVRDRLVGVSIATEQGHDWIEALRHFGLIGAGDFALLESARRAGNLSWALRELAEGSARRLAYTMQAFSQAGMATLLLAIGGFVGFVAVAFFMPLVRLIERLT